MLHLCLLFDRQRPGVASQVAPYAPNNTLPITADAEARSVSTFNFHRSGFGFAADLRYIRLH
jgi:hypothetical protein